jgi:hypothetical protein
MYSVLGGRKCSRGNAGDRSADAKGGAKVVHTKRSKGGGSGGLLWMGQEALR